MPHMRRIHEYQVQRLSSHTLLWGEQVDCRFKSLLQLSFAENAFAYAWRTQVIHHVNESKGKII